jgi:hypothetical protein
MEGRAKESGSGQRRRAAHDASSRCRSPSHVVQLIHQFPLIDTPDGPAALIPYPAGVPAKKANLCMMDVFSIIGKPVNGESGPRSSKVHFLIRRSYLLTWVV